MQQRPAEQQVEPPLGGGFEENVGAAAILSDAGHGATGSAILLLQKVDSQQHGQAAQRSQGDALVLGQARARAVRPQRVDVGGAQPLSRAPGPAHQPLGRRPWLDQDQDTVANEPRASGVADQRRRLPGLDILGHLAQGQLAQRRQPLGA